MKNILLIGGSHGIGQAVTNELLRNPDCNVIVASRTPVALSAPNLTYLSFDAGTDRLNPNALPEVIDGLVYCPGTINLRPFKGLKMETFENDLKVNFLDMVAVVQQLLPQLIASEQSSIVLFSSIAATKGMPFHTSIAAAKGAVEGFAKALAAECAPKIRVNVIAPSLTDTPLAEKFLNTESKQEKSNERHPLKRYGKTEDFASLASFLLDEKASWISGQVFAVDGGLSTLITNS